MKKHDTVALTRALLKLGLKTGDVGTIVDEFPVGYEVEFANAAGRTIAITTIESRDLRLAEPVELVNLHRAEIDASKHRTGQISSEFLFLAYLFAVAFPILGIAFSIYLAFRRKRIHSYFVTAVWITMLVIWRFVLS